MIELCHLSKSFDGKSILDDLSLSVPTGKKITIIGPSGSGKSTLLKLILCLIKPDSGKVLVDGQDMALLNVDEMYGIRKKIGLLFQSAALFDSMTVEENVGFSLLESPTSLSSKDIQEKIDHALDLVEMSGFNVEFSDEKWKGVYDLHPFNITDGAGRWTENMYSGIRNSLHLQWYN